MRFLKTSVLVLAVEIMKQPPGKPEFSSLQVSGAVCNDPVPSFGVDIKANIGKISLKVCVHWKAGLFTAAR